ncbi:ribosomal protein L1p/L10e family-domain-containing protein [Lentinula lateritia]|uniref:Ribosomal protein L1p/L10e family-domain-containing protein n=1 Tax=Lentinula lateritia TaxID=40482 RepID=A0ABQ8VKK8_9AGAR|nr:ribosomal protein L1p/L10e family-domain-containing protein [Lentinula lateritia]
MAKDKLIDDRVSLNQCKQAVDALFTHVSDVAAKKADTQLLPDAEQSFWLTVALKKQPQSSSLKVFTIPVAYPIVDPRKESVCLITKDPQRTYKDLIVDNDIHFVHKVVGIEKLKGKFKAYDARRALLKEHGLFLADKRIIPLLPKLLGSKFFEAKKQPLPVTVTRKDLKKELERAINSTYMPSIRGTSLSIKVGRFSQPAAQVVANIQTALPAIAARVNGGWDNIQGLGLKTSSSVNLPIWSCSLDDTDGGRWAGLTAEDEGESEGEEDEDEDESQGEDEDEELEQDESMDSDEADKDVDMDGDDEKSDSPAVIQTVKSKGKKRAADADEDNQIVASPKRKKSKKSSDGSSLSARVGTVDVPTTSKKSKPIVSTPAKTVAKESATSISPAKDVVSASKPRAKKGTVLQAPTPTASNTPAITKKAAAAVDKTSTKKKSAETTDAADAASVSTTTIPNTTASKDALKKDKKKEGKTSPTASGGLTKPAPTPIVAPIATTSAESMAAPANKSKKPRASKTAPVEPLVDVSVSTHVEPPSTQKKGNNVGVKAKKVDSVATVVEEKETSSSKKAKKEKKTALAVEVSEKIPTVEVEVKDEDPKKKRKEKKAKLSSDGALETEVTDAVTENAKEGKEEQKKEKKKKGKKSIDPATGPEDDAMIMDTAPAMDAVEKKPKKDKKSLVSDEKEVPASLSREELKKKKSEAPGEKKKNKVSKAKGGKSVKDSLLGKKVV